MKKLLRTSLFKNEIGKFIEDEIDRHQKDVERLKEEDRKITFEIQVSLGKSHNPIMDLFCAKQK